MAHQAGRTGDVTTPTSVAGPASHVAQVRPLLGYLRVPTATPDKEVESLRRELADYANRDGFVLLRVFVDRHGTFTSGFSALFQALHNGAAQHVVVPTLSHFAAINGVRAVMKELLEAQTGARVLVLRPEPQGSL